MFAKEMESEENIPSHEKSSQRASEKESLLQATDETQLVSDNHTQGGLSIEKLEKWRKVTIVVCLASIVFTLLLGIGALVVSQTSDSSSAFAVALDAVLAIISSGSVIWRFYYGINGNGRTRREWKACTIIASCFIFSGVLVVGRAVICIATNDRPRHAQDLLIMSVISCVGYFLLFLVKLCLAKKLESSALVADSIDALSGSGMSAGVITSTLVLEYIRKAWLIDPCTAIAIALATVIYGIEILLRVEREKKQVKKVREAGQELQEEQDAKRESDKKR